MPSRAGAATGEDSEMQLDQADFTQAMISVFDEHRKLTEGTWRQLSAELGISESLMSYYRKGEKAPSLQALLMFDRRIPGFWERLLVHLRRIQRHGAS